jgi:hypothetical protein
MSEAPLVSTVRRVTLPATVRSTTRAEMAKARRLRL